MPQGTLASMLRESADSIEKHGQKATSAITTVRTVADRIDGALIVGAGEHLMVDDPHNPGSDRCLLCARDEQDLPDTCERSVSG